MRQIPTSLLLLATALSAAACVTEDAGASTQSEMTHPIDQPTALPLLECDADLETDPLNCGACGNVCGSGLCFGGTCADDRAGHAFVIGSSYRTSNPALDRVLGNAVFVTEKRPAQIVTWLGPVSAPTPADVVAGTNAALTRAGQKLSKTFAKTRAKTTAMLESLLPTADVFLVYAQPQASDASLASLATEWQAALDGFARRGGIIVVLDTPGANGGTAQLLSPSVMTLTGRAPLAGIASVAVNEDIAAARVPLVFALADSVGYAPSGYVDVASGDDGAVVVVHRAIY